jgi:hypothetical protein
MSCMDENSQKILISGRREKLRNENDNCNSWFNTLIQRASFATYYIVKL